MFLSNRDRRPILLAGILLISALPMPLHAQPAPKAQYAGKTEKGFLLPNGWTLTPAGDSVTLTDLPLSIIPLADNRHALAASSGYNTHNLVLVDLVEKKIVASQAAKQSWFGLALSPKADRVWWSGGGSDRIHEFKLDGRSLSPVAAEESKASPAAEKLAAKGHFKSGLAFDKSRSLLYTLDISAGAITSIDLATGQRKLSAKAGTRPYDVAIGRTGNQLYVSDWASRSVRVIDPTELRTVARIPVGEHPNQIAVHPSDDRIFVACSSSNSVSVIDTKRGVVTETIQTPLFPNSPEGSTPDALALAPDGKTLFVANADNNCVAVVDIAVPSRSQVKGFIPTGWYPTSVAVTPDGKTLLVGVGKGDQTRPNPIFKNDEERTAYYGASAPVSRSRPYPYIGTTLSGSLAIIPIPDEAKLAAYTEAVYKNCPYSDKLMTEAPYPTKTAIPTKVGEPSPIKYVLYIIKENRTYDQVFGDIPKGNGDPSLVLFGRDVTPNHHKLAGDFVLLDNLYCNGHVSADGHPWSTMAYHTDYIARNWALTYSSRVGIDDDDEGNLSNAPSGYLWDACARAGLTYRSYGEYGRRVSQADGTFIMEGRVPGLVGHFSPDYGIAKTGKRNRDTDNAEVFLSEYRGFEKNGTIPRFMVMSLGEDHTTGTKPGTFTPQACVASNDLALGRIVEGISHGKHWHETAIFVIEDDAQNGPDHVDAHRTVGLVISPYTKRKSLDSNQYSTVSMIRTMELILGLPPLSQFDAAARPMFASFTDTADLTPYTHEPARIDLNAMNTQTAYGADRSLKMDFDEYDEIDDFELNEILWRAIKGKDAPPPPAVRRAIAYRPGVSEKTPAN